MDDHTRQQLDQLKSIRWKKDHAALLSQARLQKDSEGSRLKTTTLKVQIYIGLLIAMLGAALAAVRIPDNEFWTVPSVGGFMALSIITVALFFWMRSMFFGFRALRVGTYNYMGVEDFEKAAAASKPSDVLISTILEIMILNQSLHNEKISYLRRMEAAMAKLVTTVGLGLIAAVLVAFIPYLQLAADFVKYVCQ